MNSSEILKKSFGFLTAAVLSASFAGCSGEKSRNSSTETPTEEATVSAETTAIVTEKNTAAEEKNVSADTVRKPYNELFSDRDISAEYGSITAEIKLDGIDAFTLMRVVMDLGGGSLTDVLLLFLKKEYIVFQAGLMTVRLSLTLQKQRFSLYLIMRI